MVWIVHLILLFFYYKNSQVQILETLFIGNIRSINIANEKHKFNILKKYFIYIAKAYI